MAQRVAAAQQARLQRDKSQVSFLPMAVEGLVDQANRRGDLTSDRRERAGDCVRFLVDDHQQDARGSIRMTSILFPIA